MTRLMLAALLACAPALAVMGQGNPVDRAIKAVAGRDAEVAFYTDIRPDCTSGPLPAIRLAVPPLHGTVAVKRATLKATNLKQCLGLEVPAFVAFYHATPGFAGADIFELEVTMPDGRKRHERVSVTVTSGTGSGQGI
ncbi:MAG TPA: hypothetical protein VHX39_07865 [Acetobacteraceae bacterium]|jgi:hypothetical protein|nr:hypothetical protein [Acetobacteraceae bacterium]